MSFSSWLPWLQRLFQPVRRQRRPRRSTRLPLLVERLEDRVVPSQVNWINPSGGNWDAGSNWSTGSVPGSGDSAVINTASAATITIQSGDSESVLGLTTASNDTLSITGGSLTVAASSTLSGPLAMTAGSLTASGTGDLFSAAGSTSIGSGSLYAQNGATVSLPQLTSYSCTESFGTTYLEATGAGSTLNLPGLTSLATVGPTYTNAIDIEALQGGQVSVATLASVAPANSDVSLIADASNSQIGVAALTNFNAFGGNLKVTNGATILDGSLTALSNVNVTLDGTGTLALSQWTALTTGSITITRGSYTFSSLTDVDSSSLYAQNGATVSLPQLTSYNYTGSFGTTYLEATGVGSTLNLPGLTSLATVGPVYTNSIDIEALQGGRVSVPALTSMAPANSDVSLIADASNSQIGVAALTNFNAFGGNLKVTNGATVLDGNLTALNKANVTLDGTGALAISQWTALTTGSITITRGSYTFSSLTDIDSSSLYAQNGATVSLPQLTSYNYTGSFGTTYLEATGVGSTLNLPGLTSLATVGPVYTNSIDIEALQGGRVSLPTLSSVAPANSDVSLIADASNSQIGVAALTNFNAFGGSVKVTNGATVLDGNLTALNKVNVTLDGTGSIATGQWTTFTNGTITVSGGNPSFSGLQNGGNFAGSTLNGSASPNFTPTQPPTDTWTGSAGDNSFQTSGNWSLNAMPTSADEVVIPAGFSSSTITSSGTVAILSISSQASLVIHSGTFTVSAGASVINAAFTVGSGASLTAAGSGTSFTASGTTIVDGASLYASGGAQLSLPKLTGYAIPTGYSDTYFEATGSGSKLVVSALTGVGVLDSYWHVEALSGGTIDLSALTTIDSTGTTDYFQFSADGSGSTLKLSALTSLNGTPANNMLSATGQGTIVAPLLTSFNDVNVTLDGSGTIATSQWASLTDGSLTIEGGSYTLSGLTNISSSSFYVQGGGSLSLPGITSYANSVGYDDTYFEATGSGSMLVVSALTGVGVLNSYWHVEAMSGGTIDLSALATINSTGTTDYFQFSADGSGSTLKLSALTSLNGTPANNTLSVTGQGTIVAPLLTSFNAVNVTLDGSGTIATSQWASLTAGSLTIEGGSYTLSGLTNISSSSSYVQGGGSLSLPGITQYANSVGYDDTYFEATGSGSKLDVSSLTGVGLLQSYWHVEALAGGTVDLSALATIDSTGTTDYFQFSADGSGSTLKLSALTSLNGSPANNTVSVTGQGTIVAPLLTSFNAVTITLDGSGTIATNQWTTFTSGSLYVTNGSYTLSGLTDVNDSGLHVSGGTLTVPSVTSYTDQSLSHFEASSAGSTLSLPGLTTLSNLNSLQINATTGGKVSLPALTSITGNQENIAVTDTGGSTLLDGNLTTLNEVSVTLDGTDTQVASSWTKFFDSSLYVTGGSYTLPGLTDVDQSGLHISNGGKLALPNLTSYVSYGTFNADGAGSVLDVSALTTVTQQNYWDVNATNGGEIELTGLTSLTSTQGISITDTGGGTVLDTNLAMLDGVSLTLDGTSTFSASQITTIAGTFTLTGGTLTLNGLTTVNNATVVASGGATLNLPGGNIYSGTTILEATGTGSTLTLAGTSLPEPANTGSVLLIEALSGGTVTMAALTSISGGPVVLECDGANSVINLSALQTFTATGGASASNGGSIHSGITLPAAPNVWINSGDGYWDTGSNWLLGVAPAAGSIVIISTVAAATVTLNYGDNISVNSVTLGNSDTLEIDYNAKLSTTGAFTNNGTLTLAPGGEIAVGGNETETASATLNEQIDGPPAAGNSGQLAVTDKVTLAGTFNLALLYGFTPSVGQDYPVITYDSTSGTFATVTGLTVGGASFTKTLKPKSLDLIVHPTPPSFTADTPTTAAVGSPYSYQLQANGTAPITYSATGLPAWAQLSASSGLLSGTPLASGTFHFSVTASNGIAPDATANVTLIAQLEPPTFSADNPPVAIAGSPFSYRFQATGTGTAPITYSATGLPSWAQVNTSTGVFSGTPPVDGTFNFSVTASNGIAPNTTENVSLIAAGGTAVTFNIAANTSFSVPDGIYAGGTTFNVGAGATVTIASGTFTGGAIFNVGVGAVVNIIDSPSFSGTLTGGGGGSVQVGNGRLYVGTGGLTLNFAGSTFQWTSGQMDLGNGNLTNLGTMTITAPVDFYNDGVLDNFGTIIQTGTGNLQLGTDGTFATTLMNEAGAFYLLEGDGGLSEISDSGSAPGQTSLDNAGIIQKTAGTGTSNFTVLGSITNTGTIEADSGTIALSATLGISQLAGNTLTAGTWSAQDGAALQFPGGTNITTNAATFALGGSGAAITGIAALSSNTGGFALTGGANFTTSGAFTNSGSLTLGAGSKFSVTGNETETAAATLNVQIGGTPASGQLGAVAVTGTATLAGTFQVTPINGFTGAAGQDFQVMTFASASGLFSTVLGFSSTFTEAINPTSLDLYAFHNPADLQVSNVSTQASATAGQPITVTWQVSNQGPSNASGNWQDSVYLSPTATITSSSILLGAAQHGGGLNANASPYNGTLTAPVPALAPGSYYVLVQVDSLYQVSDPNRANNTVAATGQLQVSVTALTLGTPYSDSFTANDQDRYYQISAAAGGSLLLTMSGSPASEENALYVRFNSLPTTYQSDVQTAPSAGPDPTLAVSTTLAGTYYILVHNQSGVPGAFTLTASQAGLTLLQAAPGTVGNAGRATLTIDGLDLASGTTYTLVGPGGTLAAATTVNVDSALANVTFDLTGTATGTYDLKAKNPDGTTTTLSGALQVTAGGDANVVATLLANSPVRTGRTSVFYVQYANVGNDDAPAPLLTLTSPLDIPMSLDPNQTPTALNLQVLGVNQDGPVAVLPPGATFQFAVYFLPSSGDAFEFDVNVTGASDTADQLDPSQWQENILTAISPTVTGAANWPAVQIQLQQMVGTTWGQYVGMLDHYAALLPLNVGNPSIPADVFQLAVKQAVAAASTSISGVAVATAPGVALAGNTISATNSTTGDIFTANILNDGSFVFPTVTPGSYTFSADDDLIDGSPAPVTVNAGQAVTGVTVTLDPAVILTGQVTAAATGAAVAGATVFVMSGSGMVNDVSTDASGNYAIAFTPGSYTLVVAAPGLARNYTNVTLAAGVTPLNFSLAPEGEATGTVSLSDGNAVQSVAVFAVLQGNGPLPYFTATSTSANFLLDSMAPGVYDISIAVPNYGPVTIANVQIGQGQTVNLGSVSLSPVDPIAPVGLLALKLAAYDGVALVLAKAGAGASAWQVFQEYFNGQGTATTTASNVPGAYSYTPSTVPNSPVTITGSDLAAFQNSSVTHNALQMTLEKIASAIQSDPPSDLQPILAALKKAGCDAQAVEKTWNVEELMPELELGNWMFVSMASDDDVRAMWDFGNTDAAGAIAAQLAGGVGEGGPPPANADSSLDTRSISGTVTLKIAPNGSATLTGKFMVTVNDTFDFAPGGLGPIVTINSNIQALDKNLSNLENQSPHDYGKLLQGYGLGVAGLGIALGGLPQGLTVAAGVLGLGVLEVYDLTCDVPLSAGPFSEPDMSTNLHFDTGMPDCPMPPGNPTKTKGTVAQSNDPNALLGPIGFGAPNYISDSATLPYTIDFENDGTAAAQAVTVTQQLDPKLNWSTFQLGSFGFGSANVIIPAGLTQYQTIVAYQNPDGSSLNVQVALDFNVQTGLLTVTYTSLDPKTGEAPAGVYDGFLPPNNSSKVGEGFVQYTVQPKATLSTGTIVNQQASVIFDTNAPLVTNTVSNTIDAVAPTTSSVQPLPPDSFLDFPVSWTGQDDTGGSGVGSFDVYVSANNGPWTLWLTNTPLTSATYFGAPNVTYAFYVTATDNVGNQQTYAPVVEAQTTTQTPGPSESENTTTPPAVTIASLLTGHTSSAKNGVAISATSGRGTWQLSTNGKTWTSVGAVSRSQALLLPVADQLRFLPGPGFIGQAGLLFQAWDGLGGTASVALSGGGAPFSANAGDLTIQVTTTGTAPTWTGSSATLTPVTPGTTSPAGDSVASVFGPVFADGSNTTAGIAVVGLTGTTSGAWEYSLNAGQNWKPFGTVGTATALLLEGTDLIRFVPNKGFAGVVTLQAAAWDGTGTDSGTANLSASGTTGGNTHFGDNLLTGRLAVNTAPTLGATGTRLPPVLENTAGAGVAVTKLLASAKDVDRGAQKGVALIGTTGAGTWQFSLNAGKSWLAVGPVSASSALLLPSTALVRFVPAVNQTGPATLMYRAWDQTVGTSGSLFAITSTGGASAFSTIAPTAALAVTQGQAGPAWFGSGAALTPVLPFPSQANGDTVASVFGPYFAGTATGIAVTALTGTADGTWQLSTDNGATWTAIGTVSSTKPKLLSGSDRIRFLPTKQGFEGLVALKAEAWDGGTGRSGTTLTATCLVNTAPTLT